MTATQKQRIQRPGPSTYVSAIGRWYTTLTLMMAQNFALRFRRSRLAVLLAIFEPLGIIGLFALVHSLIARHPAFGSSFILFFGTGVLPYYLCFHLSMRVAGMEVQRRMPRTTDFDVLLSHVLDEFLLKLIIMVLLFGFLWWFYGVQDAIPANPARCLAAMAIFALLGIGLGMINAVIASLLAVWRYLYGLLMRAMIMFSGIWYVLDWMPKGLRDWAVYVPIAHAVTLFRSGYYDDYPILALDIRYLLLWTFAVLGVGCLLELSTKEWRPST